MMWLIIHKLHPFLLVYFLMVSMGREGDGNGVINKCIDKERQALLRFKASLKDPNGFLSTWGGEEDDCCKWRGVMCNNQTHHVTKLDLFYPSSAGLIGEISSSLLNLTYLNHLDLSDNYFLGPIPTFIGSMTRLRYLNLAGSFFSGTIPDKLINSLTELRYLNLENKYLNGIIPKSIGSLTELRYLNLALNNFKESIPKSIGSLTKLSYLELGWNNFNGTILKSIGFMTRLRYVSLEWNYFNGTIPKSIGSLTELRYVSLERNYFTGTIPISIGSWTKLRYLNLGRNYFIGILPPEFGNLTNLQLLLLGNLGRCSIENIDWLSHLSQLQYLDMAGISLAKANHWVNMILSLKKLSSLNFQECDLSLVKYPYSSSSHNFSFSSSIATLNLGSNNLNSSMYNWLFPLTSNRLDSLDLSSNMLDGIPKYLGNMCSLTSLYLSNNSAVIKFPDFLNNLSGGCTTVTLTELHASSSQLIGSLSDDIQNFSSLERLFLSHNHLSGTISEEVWQLPKLGDLDVSSNYLSGAISEKLGNSKLFNVNLSNNSLEGVLSEARMSNHSYVVYIDLSSCQLGPRLPQWIQTLKNLSHLDISNNRISDTIPVEFWNMWPSQLAYLNLSSNNISGKVPDLLSNFDLNHSVIDLSTHNFYGPILNVPSSLVSLNLSKNKFYGGVSFLCQIVDGLLSFLDLSHNSFTGPLPDCLWHFKEVKVLNMGYNNLSGRLPTSLGYLDQLEVLYLYNNEFIGELPSSLKNCTMLKILDLGANRFSGNVPVWIGENISGLYALSLRLNNFFGTIPLQLCRLVCLQILDLSMNNLSGTIPTCINNLTLMVQEGFTRQNVHSYSLYKNNMTDVSGYWQYFDGVYVDQVMIKWQGNEHEFTSNLRLLKIIDFSSNNITGQMPNEVTDLHELLVLNLSKNALIGKIPQKMDQMKKLLSLDLSRNNISGGLPSSMSEMTSLDYLDVSYNNLSGRIPSSTQLQSFEPSRYIGNKRLCGLPITKYCPDDKELELPPVIGKNKGDEEDTDELQRWFYIGGASGFGIGFWIACCALLLNHHGRHAFFHLTT